MIFFIPKVAPGGAWGGGLTLNAGRCNNDDLARHLQWGGRCNNDDLALTAILFIPALHEHPLILHPVSPLFDLFYLWL